MPIRFDKDSENIVTITFDAPGAPVNTMTAEWQTAFTETVARLASEIQREKTSIKGVILASGKKSFFAGAELKDVLKFAPDQGPEVFRWIEGWYNARRRHSSLGYLSPADYEELHMDATGLFGPADPDQPAPEGALAGVGTATDPSANLSTKVR